MHTLYGTPVFANNRTPLGCFINAALDKNIYASRHDLQFSPTDTLIVIINEWQFHRIGYDIPRDKAIHINRFLEASFDKDLYTYCQANIRQHSRYRGYALAIEAFAQLHDIDIDIDITFDALKKSEYRYRKRHQRLSVD